MREIKIYQIKTKNKFSFEINNIKTICFKHNI